MHIILGGWGGNQENYGKCPLFFFTIFLKDFKSLKKWLDGDGLSLSQELRCQPIILSAGPCFIFLVNLSTNSLNWNFGKNVYSWLHIQQPISIHRKMYSLLPSLASTSTSIDAELAFHSFFHPPSHQAIWWWVLILHRHQNFVIKIKDRQIATSSPDWNYLNSIVKTPT